MKLRSLIGCLLALSFIETGAAAFAAPPTPASMVAGVTAHPKASSDQGEPVRVVQADLDYVYDDNPDQLKRNLDAMVDRIRAMHITAVYLQAFADPKGTELASQVYFPTHELPMRADLFGLAVKRLKDEAGVKVYGWMPVLSFDIAGLTPVMAWDEKEDKAAVDPKGYHRLSPFDDEVRAHITALYEDMARSAPIDGLLFHDDAMLSDTEDASPAAMQAYKKAGFPESIKDMRADPKVMQRWTAFKTEALIAFTHDLTAAVAKIRGPVQTTRNLYARVIMEPESRAWFAQDYDRFLHAYDFTAIEAMPRMEDVPADQASDWMQRLIVAASSRPEGLKHTIFELQSVDWRLAAAGQDRAVPADELSGQMHMLTQQQALNFGYYPDDFVTNTPDAAMLHQAFSLQTDMYRP